MKQYEYNHGMVTIYSTADGSVLYECEATCIEGLNNAFRKAENLAKNAALNNLAASLDRMSETIKDQAY